MKKDNTVRSILAWAQEELQTTSDSARLDAELLLSHALNKNPTWLIAWPDNSLSESQSDKFRHFIQERKLGKPVAYLTGSKEFWSLPLLVTPDVLIPRPETELFIEILVNQFSPQDELHFLDLGTGSGAIAIALAKEFPLSTIVATDFSQKALKVAQYNIDSLKLHNIELIHSNWYDHLPNTRFDIIVSNPPYIKNDDIHLTGDIRHEPLSALTASGNGLADIKTIVRHCENYLKPDGRILIEHGYDQGEPVKELLSQHFKSAKTLQDYSGNDRISIGHQLIA